MNILKCKITENLPGEENHLTGSPAILKNDTNS